MPQVQSALAEVAEEVVPSAPALDGSPCHSLWSLLLPAAMHSAAKRELVARQKHLDLSKGLPDSMTAAFSEIDAAFFVLGSSISLHLMESTMNFSTDSLHCLSFLFGPPSASRRSPSSAHRYRRTMPVGISFFGKFHIASHWSQPAPFRSG